LGSKNIVNVERFDIIRIETPGGGGFGVYESKKIYKSEHK